MAETVQIRKHALPQRPVCRPPNPDPVPVRQPGERWGVVHLDASPVAKDGRVFHPKGPSLLAQREQVSVGRGALDGCNADLEGKMTN